jgi:hypothetical protein
MKMETFQEPNPEGIDNARVCGLCGQPLFPRLGGWKCSSCGTMHFFDIANETFINGRFIDFGYTEILKPVF